MTVAERQAAVLEAAARILGEDPGAGMAEIAAAAGVGRATLYRRYPSREALVAALREQAYREAEAAAHAVDVEQGSVEDALRDLVRSLMDVRDRFRFLAAEEDRLHVPRPNPDNPIREQMERIVERGRREGVLARSLPAGWCRRAIGMLTLGATVEVAAGRLGADEAAEMVTRTALRGLGAEAPSA